MSSDPLAWFVVVLVVNCLSPVCYLWLLCKVRKNPLARSRLFLRQIASLAAAGIGFNVTIIPVIFINLRDRHGAASSMLQTCNLFMFLFRTARNINLLQEMQIAVTFLCQCFHFQSILPVLHHCGLYLVWGVGLTLGILAQFVFTWTYDEDMDRCLPAQSDPSVDLVSVVLLSACVLVSMASSLASLWRSKSPQVVRRQNFLRATVYPAVTLVSYVPVLVAYFDTTLLWFPQWYEPFGLMMECSNGMLNTLAFALQSRHARFVFHSTIDVRACASQAFASWHVDFGGVDVIDMLPAAASHFTASSDPSHSHARGSSNLLTVSAVSRSVQQN